MRPEKISDSRPDSAPILSQIKNENGFGNAIAVLTLMIHELKEWFNVKCNLNPDQEALTAELILDDASFYDLTLGNIKACFRQHMKDAKLYDRLDGNIIIGWLRKFKSDMADHCENVSLGRDAGQKKDDGAGAISHTAYMEMLKIRVAQGDESAQKILSEYQRRSRVMTDEQTRVKTENFLKIKAKYLKDGIGGILKETQGKGQDNTDAV